MIKKKKTFNIKMIYNKIFSGQKHNTRNTEEGVVIIIVAVSMVVLLGIAALSIDIGLSYLGKGQLQKAIDAAVYSAGRQLPVEVSDINAQNAIKDSAISYSSLNGYSELTRDDITLGGVVSNYYTDIEVTANQTIGLNFSQVLGINTLEFTRSAKAKISPVKKATGVAPLGVQKSELVTRIDTNDLLHVILKYGNGDGTQSSFGALDLDGKSGGASDYRLWIAQGYPGEVTVGDILVEESGNMSGPTYSGFTERYEGCTHYDAQTGGPGCTSEHYISTCPRIIKVAVYTSGSQGSVTVDGFAAFLLENQSQDGYITGSFLNMITPGATTGGDLTEDSYYGIFNLLLIK